MKKTFLSLAFLSAVSLCFAAGDDAQKMQAIRDTELNAPVQSTTKSLSVDPFVEMDRLGLDYEVMTEPKLVYYVDEQNQLVRSYVLEVSYIDEQGPQRDQLFFDAATGAYLSTVKGGSAEGVDGPLTCFFTQTTEPLHNAAGTWHYFYYQVPACATRLDIDLTNIEAPVNGNANLYVRYLSQPTTSLYDARSIGPENYEHITLNAKPGTWVVGVYGKTFYWDAILTFQYQ